MSRYSVYVTNQMQAYMETINMKRTSISYPVIQQVSAIKCKHRIQLWYILIKMKMIFHKRKDMDSQNKKEYYMVSKIVNRTFSCKMKKSTFVCELLLEATGPGNFLVTGTVSFDEGPPLWTGRPISFTAFVLGRSLMAGCWCIVPENLWLLTGCWCTVPDSFSRRHDADSVPCCRPFLWSFHRRSPASTLSYS